MKLSVTPILVAAFVLPSAARAQNDAAGIAYFEKHVRPILAQRCYACHSVRAKKRSGGLLVDSRQGILAGGDSGLAIVPGKPEASLLMRAVRYQDEDLKMPPKGALPKREVTLLSGWIERGAPYPEKSATPDRNPSDPVAGRAHWAFRPLNSAPVPGVTKKTWAKRPLDRFVLARLEQRGLQPAGDADKRTLMRRLFVQLTGLPPTDEQARAFLDDKRPGAYGRLVERLLAAPQFGERWGRHWLDLARYADSNGLDENFLFRQAWRYRNWVIEAVNDDVPFDRFLAEQLAGDLLPFDSIQQRDRQRLGTGFLVVGPKVLLGVPRERQKMEVADEQIDTIGRAVLAQTLGCARCHDHKFDPVPTADYYALAGIMTSTSVMEHRQMLGSRRYMERLVGLGETGPAADDAYEKYWIELPKLKARMKSAKSALEHLKKKEEKKLAALIKSNAASVAESARNVDVPMTQRVAAQQALLKRLAMSLSQRPAKPARAMVALDVSKPADESIRRAGQADKRGRVVPRGFLRVLSTSPAAIDPKTSGRQELASWLTDVESGAGALAARVLANRVWHHLVGRGLVATVDNFGRTGGVPSHPGLLDYLARRLIESNWSVKGLIRDIVHSRTFQMSVAHDSKAQTLDPENRLLWRAHRRRMDPESLRDHMLAVAGELDLAPLQSTVEYLGDQATGVGVNARRRTDFPNRTLYLPVIRNDLPELFDVFDFADPHATTGARPHTTVATQGLFLLNDDLVHKLSAAVATRLVQDESLDSAEKKVVAAFRLILRERPSDDEKERFMRFYRGQLDANHRDKERRVTTPQQALTLICHAMFASSRFQYVE